MAVIRFNRPVINVSDMDRSVAFYRDLLGMVVVSDNSMTDPARAQAREELSKAWSIPNVDIRWVIMEVSGGANRLGVGREIELLQFRSPKPKAVPANPNNPVVGPPIAWAAFNVENLQALRDELEKKGVKFRGPTAKFAGGSRGLCYAIDPDGYTVELGGTL